MIPSFADITEIVVIAHVLQPLKPGFAAVTVGVRASFDLQHGRVRQRGPSRKTLVARASRESSLFKNRLRIERIAAGCCGLCGAKHDGARGRNCGPCADDVRVQENARRANGSRL